jgi:tetratricopeptide (TPR) repeat protein
VGEAIEDLYANRIEEQVEILARHYSWSSELDRALVYLILAGQKAARSSINEAARQNFEQALALLSEVQSTAEQEMQVYTGLGDALVLAGEYQAAREHYQSAQKTIPEDHSEGSMKDQSTMLRKIATTYERQGEYDQAIQYLQEAQQLLIDSPFQVEKAQVLNDIGWIDFRRGSLEAAETSLINALALVENTTQYDMTASIYNRLGGIYFQKDQLDQASHYVRKSLVLREEIGDIMAVARSYNNLGLLGWKQGDWSSALANFMRSVELHANLGDVEGSILLHSNLGLLQIDRGEADEAGKHLNSALSAAQQIGHSYVIGITYLHLSRLSVSIEDWKTALDYAGRSLEIIQGIGDRDSLVEIWINLGQAWLGLQDLDQARQYGEEALKLLEQPGESRAAPQNEHRGRALRLLGEIARLQGNTVEAGQYLRECAAIFEASGNQLEQGRSSMALARLAAERGDVTGTRILLNEARLIFNHLGAPLDLRKLEKIAQTLSTR